jgi:hypothetical protein
MAERLRESPGDRLIILTYDPPRRRYAKGGIMSITAHGMTGGDTGAKVGNLSNWFRDRQPWRPAHPP